MRGADVSPMVTAASVRWARTYVNADTGAMKRNAARAQRRQIRSALSTAHLLLDLDEVDVTPRRPVLDSRDVC